MAKGQHYSKHQQGIIKRYYDNQDTILLQRLSDYVTDLYLAEGKKAAQVWKKVEQTLEKMGVPKSRIDHIMEQADLQLLANLVTELQG